MIEPFDEDECWRRLQDGGVGRLVIRDGYDLDLVPVVVTLTGRRIHLRTPVAADLAPLLEGVRVVVEIDGQDHGELWSVVVKGAAAPSVAPRAETDSSTPLVLDALSITGRRFPVPRTRPAQGAS